MTRRRTTVTVLIALVALVAALPPASLNLRFALEDRADPNPRQLNLAAQTALVTVALLISRSGVR
jgi:hypothetical protein